jgi:hypothetical protein
MTEKKKCKQSKECKDGHHTFIITNWRTHGGQQKAIAMRCRHCLMPMSLEEFEMKEWREEQGME